MLAMGLAAALVAVYVEHHYGGATGAAWQLSALERILVAGRAVWFYAGKLAWPVNLLSVYPRWQVSTSAWWQYLYPVGAAALVGVLWRWRGRLGRGPLAAVLCFGVLVSPLVGIFNVAYHLYSFVADHFQYHAAPALFALFASGVVRLRSWNGRALGRAVDVGSGVLVLALAVLTTRHVQTFRDEKTRCLRTIEGNPTAWSAMYNLGLQLKAEGDLREALHWYAEALKLTPGNPEVLNNVGVALMGLGDAPEAVRSYREALRLGPRLRPGAPQSGRCAGRARRPAVSHPRVRGGTARQTRLRRGPPGPRQGPRRRRSRRGRAQGVPGGSPDQAR